MDRCEMTTDDAVDSPPREAWLFAQAILGRPIPRVVRTEIKGKAHRAELESFAQLSARHGRELSDLQAAEREARRNRELLEWVAEISTEAREKLRAIQQLEAQERRAWHAIELFTEADSFVTEWNEADHPRAPKGTPIGGQWVEKGGGGGISTGKSPSPSSGRPSGSGHDESDEPSPHMLDLAHAWWQTKNALDHAGREIEELPKRIERYHAQRNSRYGQLYQKNLAKAQEELETAMSLIPQLEAQLRDLKQEYHDAGYDDVGYSTFTPAETIVSGKGIEEVGHAVARGAHQGDYSQPALSLRLHPGFWPVRLSCGLARQCSARRH